MKENCHDHPLLERAYPRQHDHNQCFQSDPDIALLSNGQTVIVWGDFSTSPDRVMMRTYDSDGTPASDEIVVDTNGLAPQEFAHFTQRQSLSNVSRGMRPIRFAHQT